MSIHNSTRGLNIFSHLPQLKRHNTPFLVSHFKPSHTRMSCGNFKIKSLVVCTNHHGVGSNSIVPRARFHELHFLFSLSEPSSPNNECYLFNYRPSCRCRFKSDHPEKEVIHYPLSLFPDLRFRSVAETETDAKNHDTFYEKLKEELYPYFLSQDGIKCQTASIQWSWQIVSTNQTKSNQTKGLQRWRVNIGKFSFFFFFTCKMDASSQLTATLINEPLIDTNGWKLSTIQRNNESSEGSLGSPTRVFLFFPVKIWFDSILVLFESTLKIGDPVENGGRKSIVGNKWCFDPPFKSGSKLSEDSFFCATHENINVSILPRTFSESFLRWAKIDAFTVTRNDNEPLITLSQKTKQKRLQVNHVRKPLITFIFLRRSFSMEKKPTIKNSPFLEPASGYRLLK